MKVILKYLVILSFCLFGSQMAFADRLVIRPTSARHTKVVHVKKVRVEPVGYVDINGAPNAAKVFVNGNYAGQARSFDGFPGKLTLKPGKYTIKVVHGKHVFKQKVRVTRGHEINLRVPF